MISRMTYEVRLYTAKEGEVGSYHDIKYLTFYKTGKLNNDRRHNKGDKKLELNWLDQLTI